MSDTPRNTESKSIDFFISRAGAQADIAKYIAAVLEKDGYSIILQDWDFHDKNFIERMHDALRRASRVILLLSPEYLASPYCTAEWTNAMAGDPLNTQSRLLFFRVSECSPDGMLRGMAYLDLIPIVKEGKQATLCEVLLAAVKPGRQRSGPHEQFWRSSKAIVHRKIRALANFTGRRSDLDALGRILAFAPEAEKPPLPKVAIHGLPGAGKSVLAIQYAWENHERYAGVWWLSAATADEIARGLVELGSQFVPGIKDMQDRQSAVTVTLDLLASGGFEKRWLLIFDDVDAPQTLSTSIPAAGAAIIITSRWSDWTGEAFSFPLGVLPPLEAVDFLLRRTERDDRVGADLLARAVGHLPLALSHAGAYCKHVGESFASYANRLPELIQRAPRGSDYERTVYATFTAACEAAFALCKEAAVIMGMVAYLAPNDIPLELIDESVMTRADRDSAVEALALLSLILVREESDDTAVLDVHRLVQTVMRMQIETRSKAAAEVHRAFDVIDRHLPHEIWETETAASSIFAAGERVRQTHFSRAKETMEILPPKSGDELKHFLTFMRAQRNQLRGVEERKNFDRLMGKMFALGADAEQYGISIDRRHVHAWRRWDKLLPHTVALIDHVSESLGNGKYTSRLHGALATIYYSQGRSYVPIEALLRYSVIDAEAAAPPDGHALAESLRNLSYFLSECRRFDEAEPLLTRALSIDVEAFGSQHPDSVRDALRLAALFVDLERPADGQALFSKISDSIRACFGASEAWPLDVERAFGRLLFVSLTDAIKSEHSELTFKNEVLAELRRLRAEELRQRRRGLALLVCATAVSVLGVLSVLDSQWEITGPLHWIRDYYRAAVHGPLVWLNGIVLSSWQVPKVGWDIAVTWIGFWLAANASLLRLEGKGVAGMLNAMSKLFGLSRVKRYLIVVGGSLAMLLFGPLFFLYYTTRNGLRIDPESKDLLIFLGAVVAGLAILVLANEIIKTVGFG